MVTCGLLVMQLLYSFGINLNVGYKGFEVSTLFQGVAKRDFPLAGSTYLFGGKNFF